MVEHHAAAIRASIDTIRPLVTNGLMTRSSPLCPRFYPTLELSCCCLCSAQLCRKQPPTTPTRGDLVGPSSKFRSYSEWKGIQNEGPFRVDGCPDYKSYHN